MVTYNYGSNRGANQNFNYYDNALPYNENLPTDENLGKSFAGAQRFDVNKLMNRRLPPMLDPTGQMGASNYQAPVGNYDSAPFLPNQGNVSYAPEEKTGIMQNIKNWGGNILDNTMLGKVAGGFDATNKRAFNFNPELRGQIDYMQDQGMYGKNTASSLPQITGGALQGKNLQSMFGSNDLGQMYEKELARASGVLEGLPDQWSRLAASEDPNDIAAYKKKVAWHKNKVATIKKEQAAAAAAQQQAVEARAATERQAGATANQMTQRREGRGGEHMSRSRDQGGLGINSTQAQQVSDANRAAGMGGWGLAQGGRAGYRGGEFVDENINVEGPNFDFNENIEMAEGKSPFDLRIDELMDTGMSWQEAYEIAKEEFGQIAEGQEDSFSDQGLASLV